MRETMGAIALARKTIESDVFVNKPDKWFKIWVFILLGANYKDVKNFKRGDIFTTYTEIMSYTKATRNEVDHCIRWLKQAKQITTQKATRGMYINIVNYNVYQKFNNYKSDTESDTKSDIKAKQKRHKSDTISKEGKEREEDNTMRGKPRSPSKTKKPGDEDPQDLKTFVSLMRASPQKHIQIIGEYADEKKPGFSTKGQWREFAIKNMRIASKMSKYSMEQIEKAFTLMAKDLKSDKNPKGFITKWGLETVFKYLEDVK